MLEVIKARVCIADICKHVGRKYLTGTVNNMVGGTKTSDCTAGICFLPDEE